MNKNTVVSIAAISFSAMLCGCGPKEIDIRPETDMMQSVVSEQEEAVTESEVTEAVTLPLTETIVTSEAVTSVSETVTEVRKGNDSENKNSSGNSGSGNGNNSVNQSSENRSSDNSSSQNNTSENQNSGEKTEVTTQKQEEEPSPEPEPSPEQNFEPAPVVNNAELKYVDGILIVNKSYPVPEGYEPSGLVTAYGTWSEYLLPETNEAFKQMCNDAANEGLTLWCQSGYRSYDTQKRLYNNYSARDGKAAADTYSARPGHSEHHTGLCFDLNTIDSSFAYTAEGKWVAENCWKYGLIIRYPQSKESITGYKYEPWHLRYVGTDLAKTLYENDQCLEEYFGLTSCYSD